ncbi:phosphonate ABC transporter, permease protein PhnE [Corynebacterium pelargi]|uniref:Phosphate-import permease protein PhnE n=1 Tax=Corynebacterium pelargi TaxID=1471400 RepID=A0A410WAV9_9CORY|nr:phosphonate ABC transporter, permease protein PhnE [Corynebacterium pelargi]QAU53092.1 Phosphate-import permease protein PhnE [Corynebacterium pelargi]GGG74922.1 phosphate-import permease protein PhnE [Corynebacterium pelargi]
MAPVLEKARPIRPSSRPTLAPSNVIATAVVVAFLVAGLWSVQDLGINIAAIAQSADNAVAFLARMFPLDFPPAAELVSMVAETLAIVFLATSLSVVLSIPVAVAAAQATSRNRFSRGAARTLIVLARAIPDLVLAIFFLRVFGLGATAGILAMALHSVGMVGKLYADAIEDLHDGPREAAEVAGASRRQQIVATIPQALLPQIIATALHRFDINLRTSVLLGYVGVGGIGLAISESLRVLDYQRGMALALVVLGLCIVTELISGTIRQALLGGHSSASRPKTWVDRLWSRTRASEAATDLQRISPPWNIDRVRRFLAAALILLIFFASVAKVDLSPRALWEGLISLPETLALFFPPSDGGIGSSVFEQLLLTFQISLAATVLGALLAVPIGVLAARNVVSNRAISGFFRLIIVGVRGIPELILAIIFVVVTGLGSVAGTLALALGAVGLLSKLIADSLEETDIRVQEATRATGATEVQIFFSTTLRQALPAFFAHVFYLLDTNFRAATLLGVIGAGGIGFQLLNAARVNQFDVVTYIVGLILIVVLAIEALAMWMRKTVR